MTEPSPTLRAAPPRRRLPAAALLLAAACAAPPSGGFLVEQAQEAYEAGRLESALRYTERAMQKTPENAPEEANALHVAILRGLGRDVEADAFADFAERYTAGEATDSDATQPSADECQRLEREWTGARSLVRRYGPLDRHYWFEIGTVAAAFDVSAEGEPANLRVLRAEHPASAWLVIRAIADAEIAPARVKALPASRFPLPQCVYWRLDRPFS